MAHGEIKDDKFFMNLDGEYKPSTEFFSKIGAKINKPILKYSFFLLFWGEQF